MEINKKIELESESESERGRGRERKGENKKIEWNFKDKRVFTL